MTQDRKTRKPQPATRDVEYVAPSDDVFLNFAHAVCQERARLEHDPRLLEPEVAAGLAGFLKLTAVLEARRLNRERQNTIDNGAA